MQQVKAVAKSGADDIAWPGPAAGAPAAAEPAAAEPGATAQAPSRLAGAVDVALSVQQAADLTQLVQQHKVMPVSCADDTAGPDLAAAAAAADPAAPLPAAIG